LTPAAIGTTFFRPFIWEARNIVMLLSALESLLILWFTLKNLLSPRQFVNFFKKIFTDTLVLYCLAFSFLFAAFVGLSSLNFGSLVRYKIPAIPFYLIAMALISGKSFVLNKKEKTV
jgi:ABC-type sulfate transport system permease component